MGGRVAFLRYPVISSRIFDVASSAMRASSSGVRFWIGWGTQTIAGEKPRDFACAAAAGWNSTEATAHPGILRLSRAARSCKLHDVHDPQSASPTTARLQRPTISWMRGSGAGRV